MIIKFHFVVIVEMRKKGVSNTFFFKLCVLYRGTKGKTNYKRKHIRYPIVGYYMYKGISWVQFFFSTTEKTTVLSVFVLFLVVLLTFF